MLVFGLVRTPSAMRGVVVFTQFFLHTYLGHPFTMALSTPHLHAERLILLGGQEGRAPSRINVDVVMREIMVVSLRKLFGGERHGRTYRKRNIRTFALVIRPAFNLSAARGTLVAVRFAV